MTENEERTYGKLAELMARQATKKVVTQKGGRGVEIPLEL